MWWYFAPTSRRWHYKPWIYSKGRSLSYQGYKLDEEPRSHYGRFSAIVQPLDFDGVVESRWLCSAINLTTTHSTVSFISISILAPQSHTPISWKRHVLSLITFSSTLVTFFATKILLKYNFLVRSGESDILTLTTNQVEQALICSKYYSREPQQQRTQLTQQKMFSNHRKWSPPVASWRKWLWTRAAASRHCGVLVDVENQEWRLQVAASKKDQCYSLWSAGTLSGVETLYISLLPIREMEHRSRFKVEH